MNEIYETVKKSYYENIFQITNLEENIHLIAYGLLAFFVPFMLGHPQLLVGTIVNASLILGATYLRGHKLIPVIVLPSIGVLAAGAIFGPFTMFLIYVVPFIWVGNAIFAYSYRYMKLDKKNFALTLSVSAFLKTAFLFSSAFVLVTLGILPAIFLTTMGLLQVYTALLGGAVAYGVIKARNLISRQ